ncbi:hypothetical protein [Formosa sp. S-31]|uniref:hypothetical protein n=1 Tax=Formosa sp. S-31 TaxID=2790949 RepID=UPI003EBFDF5D
MKNIVLASALVLGGAASYANPSQTIFFHDGIMDEIFQEEFSEITINNLPVSILEAVQKDFTGADIDQAYVNELKEYKLELSLDGVVKVVYADQNGNWINK